MQIYGGGQIPARKRRSLSHSRDFSLESEPMYREDFIGRSK
jgi:hypothetical protein